jgi:hypothetical protein
MNVRFERSEYDRVWSMISMRFDDNDKKKKSITSSETWSKIKARFECDKSDSRIVVNEDCDEDEDRSHV